MPGGWRFWIDRGGTFTDVVCRDPAGRLRVRKVLSVQPGRPGDPAVAAIRQALGLAAGAPIPEGLIAEVRLGTTVATNALLEHRGAPVLLLINAGFADLLTIGDQHRPEIFALRIERPRPLEVRVIEVGGRLAADGTELEPLLCDGALAAALGDALAAGYRSVAVALLHSYRNPAHELALGDWLRQQGVEQVVLSHQLSRRPRLVPRGQTALVEAAVAPILNAYLAQVRDSLGRATPLRVMRSSGALAPAEQLQAKDTILSGPAGGMVGAVAAALAALPGQPPTAGPILGFDMGGTSTDVFHFDPAGGEAAWERQAETEVAGLRLQAPMLPIHTVAAGGGSIIRFDGERLLVGPESAGADPGPAAYRRGGPATISDANLLLGRLPAAALPAVFGAGGDQPADLAATRQRFAELAEAMGRRGHRLSPEQIAEGALRIAIERMAGAIRQRTIQRGHDIRAGLLVSYGGAGGQHACRLAEALGIQRLLLHPLAGVLSAYGIGMAEQRQLRERPVRAPLTASLLPALQALRRELAQEAEAALRATGDLVAGRTGRQIARLELRYPGSEQGLELLWSQADAQELLQELHQGEAQAEALRQAFAHRHRQRYGYLPGDRELVVERLSVEVAVAANPPGMDAAAGDAEEPAHPERGEARQGVPPALTTTRVWLGEAQGWQSVPLWQRQQLAAGDVVSGPALIVDPTTTLMLEPHWQARRLADGELLVEHSAEAPADPQATVAVQIPAADRVATHTEPVAAAASQGQAAVPAMAVAARPGSAAAPGPDPVLLELFNHRFAAIAEQMGVQLQQSSRSVNIRERLDFSCAVFDGQGQLVANAPHIPVHLGSMGESVVALLQAVERGERPPLQPGDVILTNDPYAGGTHLPDITAITPVFAAAAAGQAAGERPLFFVASRGHHADVGGITPGSMPAFSRSIAEEGLLLRNVPFLRNGHFDEAGWLERLAAGPWPVRNPEQLLADLQAQVAANRLGADALLQLTAREGLPVVQAYMAHVQAHAAEAVRRVIGRLRDGRHSLALDDGSRISVAVRVQRAERRVVVDFSGTSPQQPGNLNAPLAVTKAVVLYVFRCLVEEAIPLNAGCFLPITLIVPEGSLLHPRPPAAVVAGNVETSQAATNALFAALGVQAAAQGTMNNLSFGDPDADPGGHPGGDPTSPAGVSEGKRPAAAASRRCSPGDQSSARQSPARQYYETICGGTGAGVLPDGQGFAGASAVQSHMTNSRLTDPEILEERFPVRLERFAIRRGSGGSGRWPGGDGVVRQLRALAPLRVALLSSSRLVPPAGLAGGGAGACGCNQLLRADGREELLAGCCEFSLQPGEGLRIATPGGGGYGACGTKPEPPRQGHQT